MNTRTPRPLALAVASALLAGGCVAAPSSPTQSAGVTPRQAHPPVSPADVSARASTSPSPAGTKAKIDTLVVAAKVYSPKYSRTAQFGAWADTDGNHCDTRNDILRRDLKSVSVRSGNCLVQTGILVDPYTGKTVKFTRGSGTSDDVQIDHIVSVADAWRSGAYAWTPGKRIQFYNDPLNLQATSEAQNSAKGDKTADRWLPAYNRCTFARRQIDVKVKWKLTVSAAEKTALKNACGTSKKVAVARVVTPGSFCSELGERQTGTNGRTYLCEKNDGEQRWIRQ